MGWSPDTLLSTLQDALLERRVHFHLSKTLRVQRVRHNKQSAVSSPETSFRTFLTKRELGIIRKWFSTLPLQLCLLSLLLVLFKLLLFQLKKFMYFCFLTFPHAIPHPGSQPSPNSLLSTWRSPTLSAHCFHEALSSVPALGDFPHERHSSYYLPLHSGNYHNDKPSLFIFSSVSPISLPRC